MIALVLAALAAQQEPVFAPDLADWEARDLEGRWTVIERETLAHSWRNVQPLTAFLEQRRELELLEWLCLYPRTEGHFDGFAAALARLDAPQWARAVEWNLHARDGHTAESARAALQNGPRGRVVDWLVTHRDQGLHPKARALLEGANDVAREDAGRWLAPWNEADVLAHLAATSPVSDFGERLRADPQALYLHQIERELRAVALTGTYGEPWLGQLLALTHHQRPEVRSLTWIALGQAPRGAIGEDRLGHAQFLVAVDDEREDERVRRAASMALSQRAEWDPRAWLVLQRVALDPDHVAWATAVDRLRDVGDEFTLEQLEALRPRLEVWERGRADDAMRGIRERAARHGIAASDVVPALERTAWSDITCCALEEPRRSWTTSYFSTHRDGLGVREALREAATRYVAPPELRPLPGSTEPRYADFELRVREWAERLAAR